MQQTTNLDLELYEATDNANLLDGYNASMRKIDLNAGETSVLISALNVTVQGFDDRISTAQSTAETAATAASTAATAATAANNALNGNKIRIVTNDDMGTLFAIPQNSAGDFVNYPYDIYGTLIENTDGTAILEMHMQFTATAAALADGMNNVEQPLLTIIGYLGDYNRYNENPVMITGVYSDTEVVISQRNNQNAIEFQWFGDNTGLTDPATVSADIILKLKAV